MVHAASAINPSNSSAPNICTYDHKPVDSIDKTDDSGLQTNKSHLDRSLVRAEPYTGIYLAQDIVENIICLSKIKVLLSID